MTTLSYRWRAGDEPQEFRLVAVPGTAGRPFQFGGGPRRRPVEVRDFYIATTPLTQALWMHVMGSSLSETQKPRHPVDTVSWDHITGSGGFLERINSGPIRAALAGPNERLAFRLPSETEWEYAARGGPQWADNFRFSGSNDADAVAWYGHRWTNARQLGVQLLGWRIGWHFLGRFPLGRPTSTHEVATKAPNQLGIYDMSGNVWEWCQDACVDDINEVPGDGTPWPGTGPERRLRGGCHHNWDLHCTVSWRYGIDPGFHDGCIGFRLVLAPA